MNIIPYEEKYRDDMIFMVLEAKNALGRIPTLNSDLLDIQGNYLAQGILSGWHWTETAGLSAVLATTP